MDGAQNIVVMAGAGLSTASGIPDFRFTFIYITWNTWHVLFQQHNHIICIMPNYSRSPNTGIYANLKKYNLPYPEAIFEIDYFRYN